MDFLLLKAKASQERAMIPLDVRMKRFKAMLAEKEVISYVTNFSLSY